ncbi:MAG: DUF4136 domain-containing protein [Gammaproteobacteria bacterium]|nr:DUF4136 domain-containing protein [Gammaproteobacteria bacterium]
MNATIVKFVLIAATTTVLAACAVAPRVYSSQKPNLDFTSYATYGYVAELGTDEPGQPQSLLTQYLIAAVDREMQAAGYRYVEEGGDLLVNFYVETRERREARHGGPGPTSYVGTGYYVYRHGLYVAWRTYADVEVEMYTEGTLNIDLADAHQRELVWEGIAIGRVTEAVLRDVQGAIDDVVPRMFELFPGRVPP